MKRLTLLRHAAAVPGDGHPDRDRPLSERGMRETAMMAHRFRARGMRPSLIVSSPAERAWETARLLARGIGYPLEFLQREPELYLAQPETVIAVLARQDSAFRDILLCAHNPGLTELARQITGTPIGDLPTCGAVIVEADVNVWCDFGTARLVLVDFPRGG